MKVQFTFYTVYVEDQFGNTFEAVIGDQSDTVQVYGLMLTETEPFSFESESWHLGSATQGTNIRHSVDKHVQELTVTLNEAA